MSARPEQTCTAFEGHRRIASGPLAHVALAVIAVIDRGQHAPVLVFDDETAEPVELDLRGDDDEIVERYSGLDVADAPTHHGRGRPSLGVTAREVTLLPRHWDWLKQQPGGASAALRRLVEAAARSGGQQDVVRQASEAVHRFMMAIGGDLPGYEEALRAFYRNDKRLFDEIIGGWPVDVGGHARDLAARAWPEG